jgi:hypothetical protein
VSSKTQGDGSLKVAIVKCSVIREHRRMNAGHFLGQVDGEDAQQQIAAAKRRLERAIAHLNLRIQKAAEAAARTQRLIDEGKIVLFKHTD